MHFFNVNHKSVCFWRWLGNSRSMIFVFLNKTLERVKQNAKQYPIQFEARISSS
jgi:hypothetical protein